MGKNAGSAEFVSRHYIEAFWCGCDYVSKRSEVRTSGSLLFYHHGPGFNLEFGQTICYGTSGMYAARLAQAEDGLIGCPI